MSNRATILRANWSPVFMIPWLGCLAGAAYYMAAFAPTVGLERADPIARPSAPPEPRFVIHPIAPVTQSRFHAPPAGQAPVRFTWEIAADSPARLAQTPVALQLSADANFSAGVTTDIAVTGAELTRPLSPGRYFWRLKVGKRDLGETRELTVDIETPATPVPMPRVAVNVAPVAPRATRSEIPLALVAPGEGQEIFDGASVIAFSWRGRELARRAGWHYVVDVAASEDFRQAIVNARTERTALTRRRLDVKPGTYFWRVRLVDASGAVVEKTDAASFSVRERPLPLPPRSNVQILRQDRKPAAKPQAAKSQVRVHPGSSGEDLFSAPEARP